ncbi:MAG: hypothetical protein U0531_00160 [Dehalococcoidia bacterium]
MPCSRWRRSTAVSPASLASLSTERIAAVAVGGYGRGEMCLFSDIDLMLLHAGRLPQRRGDGLPRWDANLKVGHAVRTVKDAVNAARERTETLTALMDARLVAGDAALVAELRAALAELFRRGRADLEAPIIEAERARRAAEPYQLLDANVKEGRGGLRTLQAIRWSRQARGGANLPPTHGRAAGVGPCWRRATASTPPPAGRLRSTPSTFAPPLLTGPGRRSGSAALHLRCAPLTPWRGAAGRRSMKRSTRRHRDCRINGRGSGARAPSRPRSCSPKSSGVTAPPRACCPRGDGARARRAGSDGATGPGAAGAGAAADVFTPEEQLIQSAAGPAWGSADRALIVCCPRANEDGGVLRPCRSRLGRAGACPVAAWWRPQLRPFICCSTSAAHRAGLNQIAAPAAPSR